MICKKEIIKNSKRVKVITSLEELIEIMTTKNDYGRKDGSQKGLKKGGRRQNQVSTCRHPAIKKKR